MISVGRCTCSMVQAMVALLPLPVMPSRVWKRSPRSTPALRAAIALGWSPAGLKSECTPNGGMVRCYRGGVTTPSVCALPAVGPRGPIAGAAPSGRQRGLPLNARYGTRLRLRSLRRSRHHARPGALPVEDAARSGPVAWTGTGLPRGRPEQATAALRSTPTPAPPMPRGRNGCRCCRRRCPPWPAAPLGSSARRSEPGRPAPRGPWPRRRSTATSRPTSTTITPTMPNWSRVSSFRSGMSRMTTASVPA